VPQLASELFKRPFKIPAAQPTPDFTEMAFCLQFSAQAPHSMQRLISVIVAFLSEKEKTAWGQTVRHILQPLHNSLFNFNVVTFSRYFIVPIIMQMNELILLSGE
jgi:hypothetical protein